MADNVEDLVSFLFEQLITNMCLRLDMLELVQARSSSARLRRIICDSNWGRRYNRSNAGSIWRFTHAHDSPNCNDLGWLLASRESDGLLLRIRIEGFRENLLPIALAPLELLRLVAFWRCILVFGIPGSGFVVMNLWTSAARRIHFPNMRPGGTPIVLRRGLRLYDDPIDDSHYVLEYVDHSHLDVSTLFRYSSREPDNIHVLTPQRVNDFTTNEWSDPLRMVISMNMPSVRHFISFRNGVPVYLTRPPRFDELPPLPSPGSLGPIHRLEQVNTALHTTDGYMALVDCFHGQGDFTHWLISRVALFRLRQNFSGGYWELLSIIPSGMLPSRAFELVRSRHHLSSHNGLVTLSMCILVAGRQWGYIIFRYDVARNTWFLRSTNHTIIARECSPTFCSQLTIMP